jgi:hypothetical protein
MDMARLIDRWICVAMLTASLVFAFAAPSRADSTGTTYVFAKRVVFDTVETDRVTARSTRLLNVVPLDDRGALKVAGKVAMPGQSSYVAAYGNRQDKLIVLLWDRVEIYDVADAAKPRFVQSLGLVDQGVGLPGRSLIEPAGADKFVLLNTRNTTELTTAGDGAHWHVRSLPLPAPAQQAKMIAPLSDAMQALAQPSQTPLTLAEGDKFRYALVWAETRRPGRIIHRKYVRQLDKASGRTASEILLATDLETID